ncbi:MAG TPA: hypothetical protein VFW42_09555, partial [Fluviicoccus sp.]|nr:hypothetical protein [Fluviicoccus sp.]
SRQTRSPTTRKQQPNKHKSLFMLNLFAQHRVSVGRIIGPQSTLSKTFISRITRLFGIQSYRAFSD